jgi:cyclic dehypoxanthinyl futalosine synthase
LKVEQPTGVAEYLRTQALSRIFLDNIDNIQSSWVTQGPEIGQVALKYGANDFGSVMMEENVVSAAGTTFCLDAVQIESLIRDAGYEPRRRNNSYELLN